MDLPDKKATFDYEYTDEFGKKYDGQFTVLCRLTLGEKHALELEKTRLRGNYQNPTEDLAGLSIILATLRIKIVKAPSWWEQSMGGSTLEDESLVLDLFNRVEEAEKEWTKKMKEKARAASPTASPAASLPQSNQ